MKCIDLKQRFGDRFKVAYEESYYAEYGPDARTVDPWLMIILCQHGEICPWGDDNLAACTNHAGPIANRLKALPYTQVAQDGDDGANVVFDVKHFDKVAQIMKPRRRRQVTEAERQRLAEMSRLYSPLRKESISNDANKVPESYNAGEGD